MKPRYNQKGITTPRTKSREETEAETIDHLQGSEPITTQATQNLLAARAALAIQTTTTITGVTTLHDKKEGDKNDSSPK